MKMENILVGNWTTFFNPLTKSSTVKIHLNLNTQLRFGPVSKNIARQPGAKFLKEFQFGVNKLAEHSIHSKIFLLKS